MPQVRYLDLVLGDTGDGARTDARLGRFVALGEPMPVGTAVTIDAVPHRITRIDEGSSPGCWLRPESVVQPVDDAATIRTPIAAAVAIAAPVAVAAAVTAPVAVPVPVTDPVPVPAAARSAALAAAAAPDDTDGGGKKRRRRGKTTMGR